MITKNWILPEPISPELAQRLRQLSDLHPLVAAVLARRGLLDGDFESFFNPHLDQLTDPLALRGMADAVRILDEAMRSGRKITVYGDYDVDGTTATAALVSYIRERTGTDESVDYYIPMRLSGYGISVDALDEIHKRQKPELLISVDCGIKSRAEVEYAKRLGINVLITDHHLPEPGKTPLGVVVNPHQDDDNYPFKGLAGVGVAYKLIAAHYGKQPAGNLDLVAMGTVADVMPLTEENRVIVAYGLQRLASTRRVGLAALIDTLGLKPERRANLTAADIGYRIGPRINALGRVGMDPNMVVELFTTKDAERGRVLAQELHDANERRKSRTDVLTEQALAMVDPDDRFIVLEMDTDVGVTGLVAGRVAAEWNRPTIVLSRSGSGSGRSPEGAPLLNKDQTGILDEFMGSLCRGGGHEYACGVKEVTDFVAFRQALNNSSRIPELGPPALTVDAVCRLAEVNENLLASLLRLEPTGRGNDSVKLMVSAVEVVGERLLGADGLHYKAMVRDATLAEGLTRPAIWWRAGDRRGLIGQHVDIVFTPEWDDYSGGVQLKVEDMRPTSTPVPATIN